MKITQKELIAEASAERLSFTYELTDPVSGGELKASSEADWLSGWDYTVEGTVSFQVAENDTGRERQASVVLTYAYGADKSCSATVEVSQAAADVPEISYDYEFEAPLFSGSYTADVFGRNGEDNYNTWLSDEPFNATPLPGGTYYRFDIFAPEPADGGRITLTPGTYKLGETGETKEFTFSPEYSEAFTMSEDGMERIMNAYFSEGTLEVTEENGQFVLEAVLTDQNSKTHHVVYRGEAVYTDPTQGPLYTPIDQNLDFTVKSTFIMYMGGSEGSYMNLKFQLSDMESKSDGQLIPPGTLLTVDAYVPYSITGEIASGTYSFDIIDPEPFSLVPGTADSYMGGTSINGTNAMYIDANSVMTLGLVSSGSMKVASDDGVYRLECDFLTVEGVSVKALYEGPIDEIVGLPGPVSDLKGDYTLNMENDLGYAQYLGNFYGTGGNWNISILPETGTNDLDGVTFDIVSSVQDFDAGIPVGTYKAAVDELPMAGEYRKGMLRGSDIIGTMYLGEFTPDGAVRAVAPALEGDLNISREDNGDYTFSFAFKDDIGNTWDGTWSGPVQLVNSDMSDYGATSRVRSVEKREPKHLKVVCAAPTPTRSRSVR